MMMKRSLLALILVLAVSATFFPQGLGAYEPNWFGRGGGFGGRGGFGGGGGGFGHGGGGGGFAGAGGFGHGGGHASPPMPRPSPEISMCIEALPDAAVCLRPPIGEECCSALPKLQAACADAKIGPLNPSALIDTVLKSHCSGGGGAAPSSA